MESKHIGAILAITLVMAGATPAVNAVTITDDHVTAHGWNSCSKGWFKTGGTFDNYCPFCHGHGTLKYNPKHTYEGEWTCMRCDADYCNCGRCKASGSHVYLTKHQDTTNTVAIRPSEDGESAGTGNRAIFLKNAIKLLKTHRNTYWAM